MLGLGSMLRANASGNKRIQLRAQARSQNVKSAQGHKFNA
jgi:hypothetical protein